MRTKYLTRPTDPVAPQYRVAACLPGKWRRKCRGVLRRTGEAGGHKRLLPHVIDGGSRFSPRSPLAQAGWIRPQVACAQIAIDTESRTVEHRPDRHLSRIATPELFRGAIVRPSVRLEPLSTAGAARWTLEQVRGDEERRRSPRRTTRFRLNVDSARPGGGCPPPERCPTRSHRHIPIFAPCHEPGSETARNRSRAHKKGRNRLPGPALSRSGVDDQSSASAVAASVVEPTAL